MTAQDSLKTPLRVSELTDAIRRQLEGNFDWVQVGGEISNYKQAPSGHAYFRLKDADAVLECVAWKTTVLRWGGLALQDGVEVIAGGSITVYPPRGQYQLVVTAIRLAGAGVLQQRFDALKQMLAEEGLFDSSRKKPLPEFPRNIAVITSPTGAAVQDFLRVVREGNCPVHCVVCPVLVQGSEAAGEIAAMLQAVNRAGAFDLIVLCRGGGSLEDLWAFNEEAVARAIAASKIPVISAVGHEIDFTIADFTADFRAPTPTAAGQIVCGLFEKYRVRVQLLEDRLIRMMIPVMQRVRERLEVTQKALRRYHPLAVLALHWQRLDDFSAVLIRALQGKIQNHTAKLTHLRRSLNQSMMFVLQKQKQSVRRDEQLLESFNPMRNLQRGFAVCRHPDGRLIKRTAEVSPEDRILLTLSDGEIAARVLDRDTQG